MCSSHLDMLGFHLEKEEGDVLSAVLRNAFAYSHSLFTYLKLHG